MVAKLDKPAKDGATDAEFGNTAYIDSEFEDISALQGDIDSELNAVTSEFGKDENEVNFKVKLHRVLEKKGEREWLFDVLPSELPIMDRVKDEYGGGRYEASLFKNGKLYRKFHFNIANPRVNFVPKQNSSELSSIIQMLADNQEKQFNQFKELILQVSKPAESKQLDPTAMMGGIMGMMLQMKQFLAPAGNNNAMGGMEMFVKGIELAKDLTSGDKETNLLDIARDLLKSPLVETLVEKAGMQVPGKTVTAVPGSARLPGPVPGPAPVPGGPVSVAPENNQPENMDMNFIEKKFIAPQVNNLVNLAKAGKDPGLYAEVLIDNLPPTVTEDMINKYLANENIIEDLSKLNPDVKNYADWFNAFKNAVQEIMTPENNDSEKPKPLTPEEKKDNT